MNWLLKRTGQSLFTIYAVITLTFVIVRLMPGGPAQRMKIQLQRQNPQMSGEQLDNLVAAYTQVNPQDPIHIAYVDYMGSMLQGDLGESFALGRPVSGVIAEALPWTVLVMALSTFLMFGIAIVLGALMAYKEGSNFDLGFTGASIVLNSIPYYVAAVVLIMFMGYRWEVLPPRARYPRGVEVGFTPEFILGALEHAIMPTLSFVITGFGIIALQMRGNSIQTLGEDYIRVAQLRGLADRRIALRYVGRNAILPLYTGFLISIGFMFGGAIILEQLFQYHGIGYRMLQSIDNRDYPVMMGCFLVITIAVVIAVWFADLTYGKLDPRIQTGGENEAY